jgi:MFS family permease
MMAASGIVAVFALLTATVKGVNGDLHSMLAQLAAWRCVLHDPPHGITLNKGAIRFFLGIGIGAEYPCGSVAASEQSEEPGIQKNRQHLWVALATSEISLRSEWLRR